ncbi:hypothetical protein C8N24_3535 [Solirubrobacter pauli]|uniref:Hemolysin type calcium-binding protein n=1 Tax=Solirubrobacter pauli TaxID=166793 RepID=A0A660LJV3_9ACTN|nr:calcium-binding protein [Solirubrobacter pauli]RKQ93664.1 hypothetical protein C8N24_3535 [Solirubrobacter pauli]
MPSHHLRFTALLAALAALAAPAAADAAVTAKRGADGAVSLTGSTSAAASISILGMAGKTRVTGPVQPGSGCFTVGAAVECGNAAPRRLDVLLAGSTGKLSVYYNASSLDNAPAWLEGGSAADVLEAIGTASVIFRGGPGDDTLTGGAGDDTFFADADVDGADVIDGRGDQLDAKAGSRGDNVSYGFRSTPVVVTLPPNGLNAPAGSHGASGEGDKLAHIESVDGGSAGDLITGNERANRLVGRAGGDLIDGGVGDDRIELRRGLFDGGAADPDIAVSCGNGQDVLQRDADDPISKDCEHDAPGVRSVEVTGDLAVGAIATATVDVFGDPGTASYQWMACTADESKCEPLPGATGPTLVIPPAAEGRHLQVRFALAPQGFAADTQLVQSPARGPVAPAPPAPPAPTPGTPVVDVPLQPSPPVPFAEHAAIVATAGLGHGTRFAPKLRLGGGALAYTSGAVSGSTLKLDRKGHATFAGVVCPTACRVRAELTLRAGHRTRRLAGAREALAERRLGVVKVALSRADLRAVRRVRKPTLTLKLSVGGVSATQRFALR